MTTLEKRIEAMEAQMAPPREPLMIFREFVSPGRLGAPFSRCAAEGLEFTLLTGETQELFRARVAEELRAALPGREVYQVSFFEP